MIFCSQKASKWVEDKYLWFSKANVEITQPTTIYILIQIYILLELAYDYLSFS